MLVGILSMIFWTSKGGVGKWKFTEVEEQFLVEIIALVVCSNRVVKMNEHLPFFREFSILCIEDRVVVDHLSNFEKEVALKDSTFWWIVCLVHKLLLSVCSLIITLISLALHMVLVYSIPVVACGPMGWDKIEKPMKKMMRTVLKRVSVS